MTCSQRDSLAGDGEEVNSSGFDSIVHQVKLCFYAGIGFWYMNVIGGSFPFAIV